MAITGTDDFAINRNKLLKWRSVGSDDITTETITITTPADITFNRILLIDHNFEEFIIDYDDGGFTAFTSVVGLDGALGGGISETTFADDTAYYEFDPVTTSIIRIRAVMTQTVDAEKFLGQFIATTELGTMVGFPITVTPNKRSSRIKTLINGLVSVSKSIETFDTTIDFETYSTTATFNVDFDLIYKLWDRENPFIIWPSGGKRGTSSFQYAVRGYRLLDAPTVQVVSESIEPVYLNNVYVNPLSLSVAFSEHR
jgi:hypothetical protein